MNRRTPAILNPKRMIREKKNAGFKDADVWRQEDSSLFYLNIGCANHRLNIRVTAT